MIYMRKWKEDHINAESGSTIDVYTEKAWSRADNSVRENTLRDYLKNNEKRQYNTTTIFLTSLNT